MNTHEIARRASALPDQFATRLSEDTLAGLRLMEEGGEFGELAIELAATLVKAGATVSAGSSANCAACWKPRACRPTYSSSSRPPNDSTPGQGVPPGSPAGA